MLDEEAATHLRVQAAVVAGLLAPDLRTFTIKSDHENSVVSSENV